MSYLKIFVYGFAHSGTTILRKIIGDHSLIYDYLDETELPPDVGPQHCVFKCPILPDIRQKDCKRIMIMKNPYDIFGSFYLRFGPEYLTTKGHTIYDYEDYLRHFTTTRDFTIRYEDLFDEQNLIRMFNYIGLEYEGIKQREAFIGYKFLEIPEKKPASQEEGPAHGDYRQWQINQPFKNMTGQSAPFLPDPARYILDNNKLIQSVYGKRDYSIR